MQIVDAMQSRFLISGHRGYSSRYPENTLLAFKEAIDLGVDMLELDLHLSADEVLMVMHDNTLDRTTNGIGLLRERTCAELKELDAGGWKDVIFTGLKIPTFAEFLTLVEPYKELLLMVEIKTEPDDIACADAAIALTKEYGVIDRCIFTSFNARVTDHIHDRYGLPNLGYSERHMKNVQPDSITKLFSVGVPMRDVTKEHMESWKRRNIIPGAYCPDTEEKVLFCIESGAAMVTCNDPVPAMRVAKERGLR
jgi:glycerophosphoryl diester phosphodiesterase